MVEGGSVEGPVTIIVRGDGDARLDRRAHRADGDARPIDGRPSRAVVGNIGGERVARPPDAEVPRQADRADAGQECLAGPLCRAVDDIYSSANVVVADRVEGRAGVRALAHHHAGPHVKALVAGDARAHGAVARQRPPHVVEAVRGVRDNPAALHVPRRAAGRRRHRLRPRPRRPHIAARPATWAIGVLRAATDAPFDADAAGDAELEYWVVHRRFDGEKGRPELIDANTRIAAEVYSLPFTQAQPAGVARSHAADLVDDITAGRQEPTAEAWATIAAELRRAYSLLHDAAVGNARGDLVTA